MGKPQQAAHADIYAGARGEDVGIVVDHRGVGRGGDYYDAQGARVAIDAGGGD
ncbi:hypothetical protein QQX98_011952 [Neonectria punicea]|uniref:Uncharacterized protein n=1 Tax=Neonectria punicea TaxID=979145 RepID=A0ABR1GK68_9HYPO